MLRHHRFGDVAFLLEPELKEGKGGLRDVHGLRAVELAIPSLRRLDPNLDEAAATLLDVRVALHRTTNKGSDRLVLQQQAAVAEELGLPDVDSMMQFLSSAARTIAWASDDKWRRVESHLNGPGGRLAKRDRVMSDGVVLRDGEIVATADAPMDDATLPVRVASAAAQIARADRPRDTRTSARRRRRARRPVAGRPPRRARGAVRPRAPTASHRSKRSTSTAS